MSSLPHFYFEFTANNSRLNSLLSDPFFKESQHKWGLKQQTHICTFSFEYKYNNIHNENFGIDSSNNNNSNNSSGSIVVGSLRFSGFHKGLLNEFLIEFFNSSTVREILNFCNITHNTVDNIDYDVLSCNWTTLEPFTRLITAGVVKRVENDLNNQHNNNNNNKIFDDNIYLPIVKRAEFYLPHDVVISDELRALFLFANQKKRNNYDNYYDDDDENNDNLLFNYEKCNNLSLSTLKYLFLENEKKEFLYHILWRLIAGGGSNNQWEDDFSNYLILTRLLYKSFVVINVNNLKNINFIKEKMEEPDNIVDNNNNNNNNNSTSCDILIPEIVSTVVSVKSVGGLSLFSRTDDVEPSNLNYCYVCIDPINAEVVLWYHYF